MPATCRLPGRPQPDACPGPTVPWPADAGVPIPLPILLVSWKSLSIYPKDHRLNHCRYISDSNVNSSYDQHSAHAGPAAAGTISWDLYDDFTGSTLDTTKWCKSDPSLIADVTNNEARLSLTQSGSGARDPGMDMTNCQGITAVKADMKLLDTSTGDPYEAQVKMMIAINSPNGVNSGYDAVFGLMKGPDEGSALVYYELEEVSSGNRWIGSVDYTRALNTYYTFAITVDPESIGFYFDGSLVESYTGQNGILAPGNYAITGVGFESRTYNDGEFVDARVDNVYTAVPEPTSVGLLAMGAAMLVATKRRIRRRA